MPFEHFCPAAHAVPQVPQLFGSFVRLVQMFIVPHLVSPLGQPGELNS
jgi:hypothetical protein